ncbi:MAG: hypothetical protein J6C00_03515 [Eubacterium sp.]|nr:hypothetical protein [Eubacterium sp.]
MDNETFVGEIATPVQNINYEKLRSAVKAIGFGYAFLYLNLNLGRVNLLPNWVGYVLIQEACDDIGEQEPSIVLLKPLAALLAGYEGVLWLCKLLDVSLSIPAVEVVISVASLYFHYQLMTNLGDLADHLHLEERDRLYSTRIWQAALTTLLGVPVLKNLCVQTGLLVATFIVLVRVVVGIIYLEGSLRECAQQSKLP